MFNNIKEKAALIAGRTGLKLKKYSPEILVGVGIVGMIATVVVASKATLEVDTVVRNHKYKMDKINCAKETFEYDEYTQHDYQKDLVTTYTQTTVDFVKLYAPAVTLGVLSVTCVLGAHNIMKRRNVAIMAAYKVLDDTFRDYRKRVVDQYGTEVDRKFKYGIQNETLVVDEVDEKGKTKKVKKNFESAGEGLSEYATLFNSQSSNMWSRIPGGNMLFIKAQQEFANYILHSRGHVFLNEVYEYLGLPHTQTGAVVGWVRGNGDDFIDFGAKELNSQEDLYNSYQADKTIVLDFNVDGLVYNLI